ncbi:MAG: prolipoprotein diacylglyceryl transferase [Cyclobacteriaceae bacterium]|nr:prolipoprotein diacylglyceryl transferase [Cyclobacteriaceae bacterium]
MYPKFSDLLKDIFGIQLLLPFSSFGIILAIAFVFGYYLFALELWRKEKEGLLKTIIKNNVYSGKELIIKYLGNGILGFFVGYKLLGIALEYQLFVNNSISYIFSFKGNLAGGTVGIIVAVVYTYFKYKSLKAQSTVIIKPYQQIGKLSFMATVFCFIGARLFHYIEDPDKLLNDPIASLTSGGLNIYGGLLFGAAYTIYFIKKNRLSVVHFGDASAPALMIAYGIARLGCHVSGDGDWGIPNDYPKPGWLAFLPDWIWSYDYPSNALNIDLISFYEEIGYESILGKAWPTPIYEFIICLLFFIFLWSIRKKVATPGMLFSIYLILNGLERFTIEMIRINPSYDFLVFHGTLAQYISVVFIILGTYGLWYFSRKRNEQMPNKLIRIEK